jgi:hypothetical protein
MGLCSDVAFDEHTKPQSLLDFEAKTRAILKENLAHMIHLQILPKGTKI